MSMQTEKVLNYIKKICKDGTIKDIQITLTEYIRHQIHHPENNNNVRYTREELKESIELMREFIQNKNLNGIVVEP